MATIHVNRGGTNLGTFSEEEVRSGLRAARFQGTDLGWREGMAAWQPLSQFTEFAGDTPQSPPATPGQVAVGAPPPPPMAVPVVVVKTEPLAIWSLVLSCLGLICCGFFLGIPGVICGHLALSKIRAQPGLEGRGLAIAGLSIGYVAIFFWLIYVVFFGGLSAIHSITHSGN